MSNRRCARVRLSHPAQPAVDDAGRTDEKPNSSAEHQQHRAYDKTQSDTDRRREVPARWRGTSHPSRNSEKLSEEKPEELQNRMSHRPMIMPGIAPMRAHNALMRSPRQLSPSRLILCVSRGC